MVEVLVGRLGRPHGVRGELTVAVHTDDPERRFVVGAALTAGAPDRPGTATRVLRLASVRPDRDRLLVSFDGIDDRDAAAALTGLALRVEVDPAESTGVDDEYFDHQLVGLTAVDLDGGGALGPVTEVLHLPLQDVLVIDHNGREVLVPFVAAVVPEVDVAAGTVGLRPPPGLLDADQPQADPTPGA